MPKKRRLTREELLARLPAGLRPMLRASTVRDLALCHIQNLDAIANGDATLDTLWHWVESVLTWYRVAQLISAGEDEMAVQLEVATRLVERYGQHRRVRFDGLDYQLAKRGVQVMDELALLVDWPTAKQAVLWSEGEVARMHEATRQAQASRTNNPAGAEARA
jgi:hypothetical protein